MTGSTCMKLHCLKRWREKTERDGVPQGLVHPRIMKARHVEKLARLDAQIEATKEGAA